MGRVGWGWLFPLPVRKAGADWSGFLPQPGELGFNNTPACRDLVNSVKPEGRPSCERADIFQNRPLSPPPAGNRRGFFSNIYYVNLLELLETNLTILWGLPMTGSPEVFNSQSGPH